MISIKLKRNKKNEGEVAAQAAAFLKKGGVAILPTDTVYGFSCLASSNKGIKAIRLLKGRDQKKPFIILAAGWRQLAAYIDISLAQKRLAAKMSLKRRPTTFIFDKHPDCRLFPAFKSLAVRLPKSSFLIKILKENRCPLISTSVNRSGEESLGNPQEFASIFSGKSNDVLLVDQGPCRRRRASRIIDLRNPEKPLCLRK